MRIYGDQFLISQHGLSQQQLVLADIQVSIRGMGGEIYSKHSNVGERVFNDVEAMRLIAEVKITLFGGYTFVPD